MHQFRHIFLSGTPGRRPAGRRSIPLPAAASALWLMLALAGCSHTRPYYRPGLGPPADIPVPSQHVAQRILLVGDAGDTATDSATFLLLRQWAGEIPQRTVIVFLGDNIYPAGMPGRDHPKRKDAEQRLSAQLDVVKEAETRAFFLSGNHDWANGKEGGRQAVARQEEYVRRMLPRRAEFLPGNCVPGPASVDLDGVRIVALNTAWWLHPEGAAAGADPQQAKDAMIDRLEALLASAGKRHLMVVAHHPLASHGTQGGFYDWQDHVFPSRHLARWLWIPTPGLGSLYPLLRSTAYNKQTLNGRAYKEMRRQLTDALSQHRPLVYAAGHDHSLQVLEGGRAAQYFLVSALGLDVGASLGHGRDTLFAHLHPGFMAVDFTKSGGALLRVIEPGDKQVVFALWLKPEASPAAVSPGGR